MSSNTCGHRYMSGSAPLMTNSMSIIQFRYSSSSQYLSWRISVVQSGGRSSRTSHVSAVRNTWKTSAVSATMNIKLHPQQQMLINKVGLTLETLTVPLSHGGRLSAHRGRADSASRPRAAPARLIDQKVTVFIIQTGRHVAPAPPPDDVN